MSVLTVRIEGTAPLLMQAETLANPLNERAREHKAVAGKRKKSEEDYLWLLQDEWELNMYYDPDMGPYLPGLNIEACIAEAGKIQRLGKTIKQAVRVVDDKHKIEFDGPRSMEKMWKSGQHTDVRGVRVTTSKVMRCRPIFLKWATEFDVEFMEDVLDRSSLVKVIEDAGRLIGVGTYRPRFGRFNVEVLS